MSASWPIPATVPAAVLLAFGLLAALATSAAAQLSPGKLSRAHASLEGSKSCLKCHESRRGVAPNLCLSCHTQIGDRIASGVGLHSRKEYAACETCHIEHHGEEFELIWWGKEGREAFDHGLTGLALEGAHRTQACRDCHRPEKIAHPESLRDAGKDLARTFLGLDSACESCHQDRHRGQFAAAGCRDCHGQVSWTQLEGFDHSATSFPLTGGHRQAECAACHRQTAVPGSAESFVLYRGVATGCVACHQDTHEGRLGTSCQSCHTTEAWRSLVAAARFDHDRTRYPLRGRHRAVGCEACHRSPKVEPIAGFDRCSTCHQDTHLGQLAARPSGGECSECHTVEGFRPSGFPLEAHQRSSFPLEGAHLAIPCGGCHREVSASSLEGLPKTVPASRSVMQFRFAGSGCPECHRDPHAGDADRFLGTDGCRSCHEVEAWQDVRFDHRRTGYVLEGAHSLLVCSRCHAPQPEADTPRLPLSGAPTTCAGCHGDPHGPQFARAGSSPACTNCHDQERGWKARRFDHNRDADFSLEGAHLVLTCAACHPVEAWGSGSRVHYRPLGKTCSDCHRAKEVP
ncbi:MAG: hypothetical protein KDD47_11975 [Acidobacteria bacterium]|nr:hypothetical protein [Acidobacteriota bacterium]